jgi:putative 4-mercaptohistidine N1-methyltranferase
MSDNIYETQKLCDEYLLFHYGSGEEVLPWAFGPREALDFAVRTVTELIGETSSVSSALDLGCAVGRSTFELTKHFDRVLGIDYSHAFVQAAERMRREGALAYEALEEGTARVQLTAHLPAGCHAERARFEQGDAMHLRADLGSFDLVHAANLLCRLPQPEKLAQRLPQLVRPGGQLLLTTPCTWLAEFTPEENWPAGTTRQWLISQLQNDFVLEQETDLPFLIREHARKFQWTVAWGTRWRRVS